MTTKPMGNGGSLNERSGHHLPDEPLESELWRIRGLCFQGSSRRMTWRGQPRALLSPMTTSNRSSNGQGRSPVTAYDDRHHGDRVSTKTGLDPSDSIQAGELSMPGQVPASFPPHSTPTRHSQVGVTAPTRSCKWSVRRTRLKPKSLSIAPIRLDRHEDTSSYGPSPTSARR